MSSKSKKPGALSRMVDVPRSGEAINLAPECLVLNLMVPNNAALKVTPARTLLRQDLISVGRPTRSCIDGENLRADPISTPLT